MRTVEKAAADRGFTPQATKGQAHFVQVPAMYTNFNLKNFQLISCIL